MAAGVFLCSFPLAVLFSAGVFLCSVDVFSLLSCLSCIFVPYPSFLSVMHLSFVLPRKEVGTYSELVLK